METSLKEEIAALFDDAEYADSPYGISITKLSIWLAVMAMLSSLAPFISHGSSSY